MPLKSKLPDVEIPEIPLHVLQNSLWSMHGDKVALVNADTGESLTYGQLSDQVQKVASGLNSLGMHRGDVLSIISRNSPEYSVLIYGTLTAGGTVNTVNPDYTIYEMSHQFKDCKSKFVYTTQDMVGHVKEAVHNAGISMTLLVLGQAPGWVSYSQLTSDDGSACPDPDVLDLNPKEDVAFLLYSSGTTGIPKGVMLTHYNIVANLMQSSSPEFRDPEMIREGAMTPIVQPVVAVFLPYFHLAGLAAHAVMFLAGGFKMIIMPRYSTTKLLQIIQDYKVNIISAVPPVVVAISKHPHLSKYDLSSLTRAGSGAAPLDRATEEEFTKKLNLKKMRQGYGMTETSPVVFLHPHWNKCSGSVGMIIPNTEVKLVDISTGREVGMGERGELWVRGPQVMKGYLNRPQATRDTIDKDGWLHTGDVAYYDKDEIFYVVDRIKELIKYKAFQVAPAEMEALLLEHPDVADAAVIGVPDHEAGELPRAYVVRQPGSKLTTADIHRFVQERAAHYKQMRGGVQFVDFIPKTETGKILRRVLKERVQKSKI